MVLTYRYSSAFPKGLPSSGWVETTFSSAGSFIQLFNSQDTPRSAAQTSRQHAKQHRDSVKSRIPIHLSHVRREEITGRRNDAPWPSRPSKYLWPFCPRYRAHYRSSDQHIFSRMSHGPPDGGRSHTTVLSLPYQVLTLWRRSRT